MNIAKEEYLKHEEHSLFKNEYQNGKVISKDEVSLDEYLQNEKILF